MKIEITLPDGANAMDALATQEILEKALPNVGILISFAGSDLPRETRDRLKKLLPAAKVKAVTS